MRDMKSILDITFAAAGLAVGGGDGDLVVSGVDRIDHEALTLAVQVPLDGGVSVANFYSLKVEHSDDDVEYAACGVHDLIGPKVVAGGVIGDAEYLFDDGTNGVNVSAAAVASTLGYRGQKRYVRLTIVANGAPTGGLASVVGILGHPRYAGG